LYRGAGKCVFQIISRRWISSAADKFQKSLFWVKSKYEIFTCNDSQTERKDEWATYIKNITELYFLTRKNNKTPGFFEISRFLGFKVSRLLSSWFSRNQSFWDSRIQGFYIKVSEFRSFKIPGNQVFEVSKNLGYRISMFLDYEELRLRVSKFLEVKFL
jgi:hypothetical protein